jgi:hypothetical protein
VSRLKENAMLTLLWNLSAAIRGYLRFYMPTNRVVDWLRTPRGLSWVVTVAVVAVPTYLSAMSICAALAQSPRLGWLNVFVLLFFWNAVKFAWIAVLSVPRILGRALCRRDTRFMPEPVLRTTSG